MLTELEYREIESLEKYILVDFRSEYEFNEATIPNAVNMPILNDEERKETSVIYDSGDKETAKAMAVNFASKKIPSIYNKIVALEKEYGTVIGFCSRGGLRSSVIVNTLRTLGINIAKLKGGYKHYRKHINEMLPQYFKTLKLVVLYGKTGSGKTAILKELQTQGTNIIDLEAYANHRGSLLGSILLGEQNSQKMFESLLYEKIKNHKGEVFFIEGESKRIGNIIIPESLYQHIRSGTNIFIETPDEDRIINIKSDYINDNDDELINGIHLLKGLISEERIKNYSKKIKEKDYDYVINELMCKYYDSSYNLNHKYDDVVQNIDIKSTAEYLRIKYYEN